MIVRRLRPAKPGYPTPRPRSQPKWRLAYRASSIARYSQVYVRARQWLALVINAKRCEDAERVEVVPPVGDLTILDGDD
jgi:hypothetical protein